MEGLSTSYPLYEFAGGTTSGESPVVSPDMTKLKE